MFHTTLHRPVKIKVKVKESFRCKTVEAKVPKKSIDITPWDEDYDYIWVVNNNKFWLIFKCDIVSIII